mmetsp:Transcript_11055/g.18341  ORF Transcript_11055/g.18341 Transcript_11055/m.18341 type:complete len:230 (-) Transcript_11055:108-797(-)|eukprot:CAMPEP_0119013852 /NCGR_PEP_ID=MMETSP1176-20130426/9095_1 /TAXON_ID=265551 /ORGANISM="Synedropsis recta cf, Strain CCMP1620" /LENGTH=229 /DNA_ID=CAMNT_0006966973 /DNA_START=152 /DNA_END=841 /DNA_ORIENTATION=+
MGIFDSVQNAGTRAKLNGEIVLIDRRLVARKKLFGVEIYDLFDALDDKHKSDLFSMPELFKGVEGQMKQPLEDCRKEVRVMHGEKVSKEDELAKLEVRRERDTKNSVGSFFSNTSTDATLKVQITMLERNIKLRKEEFGLDVWQYVSKDNSITGSMVAETTKKTSGLGKVTGAIGGLAKGVTSGVTSGLGKLSKDERDVQECLEKAKEDVGFMERSKERKNSIIAGLGK